MKIPNKEMSKEEFSFFVIMLCVMLASIAMIIVLFTSVDITMGLKAPLIISFILLAIVCATVLYFLLASRKNGDK